MPVWSFKPNLFIKENKQIKKFKKKPKHKTKLHSSTRINATAMQEQMNVGDGTSPAMTL